MLKTSLDQFMDSFEIDGITIEMDKLKQLMSTDTLSYEQRKRVQARIDMLVARYEYVIAKYM